jgi:hypothetical protein
VAVTGKFALSILETSVCVCVCVCARARALVSGHPTSRRLRVRVCLCIFPVYITLAMCMRKRLLGIPLRLLRIPVGIRLPICAAYAYI